MGYVSVILWIMLLIMGVVIFLIFKLLKKWVVVWMGGGKNE